MASSVRFTDHSDEILRQLQANVRLALTAIGAKGVSLTLSQMQNGYGKPIYKTGTLQRDVQFAVENSGENSVDIGNTKNYAVYVHEGTSRMAGRPYVRDAILGGSDAIRQVAEAYIRQNF